MARDWMKSLWQASFKGVPFWIERDSEHGGRRLALHEFPHRDDPFVEDMGRKAKTYQVTAYLVGDTSDAQSSSLASIFDGAGSGTLVLPVQGPIGNVWCEDFSRDRAKDRMGYVAYSAKFVRDGGGFPSVPTLSFLQQLAYDAADAMPSAVLAALSVSLDGPAYLAENAVAGFETAVAALDAIRAGATLPGLIVPGQTLPGSAASAASPSPLAASDFETSIQTLFNTVPLRVTSNGVDDALVTDIVTLAIDLAASMEPEAAVIAFAEAYDAAAPTAGQPVTLTANAARDVANRAAVLRVERLAMLAAYVTALVGCPYQSRPDAIAARSELMQRFDIELNECHGAQDADLYVSLQTLRSTPIAWLTALIGDLRPVVTVSANRSMPSLWWAWRLYQDPSRSAEIIARNRVPHPAFCPQRLQVLAPRA